jgi:TonB family protein
MPCDLGQGGASVNRARIAQDRRRKLGFLMNSETDMKHLLMVCLALAACSTPATQQQAAVSASPVADEAQSGPAECPAKTGIPYRPPLPEPAFIPAPPRGATLTRPQRLLAAEPGYPNASRRCHEEGKVTITYCVSAEGKTENVQVLISSGYARLDNSVLVWATRDRHTPGMVNGRPHRYCGVSHEQSFQYAEEAAVRIALR